MFTVRTAATGKRKGAGSRQVTVVVVKPDGKRVQRTLYAASHSHAARQVLGAVDRHARLTEVGVLSNGFKYEGR